MTLGQARGHVEARLRQTGWQVAVTGPAKVDGSSAPAEPKVLAALPNARACSVTLLTADADILKPPPPPLPPSVAPAPAPEVPSDPSSPAVPLAAGALGAAILARVLWPRHREAAVAVVAPPDTGDPPPRLRVRRDEV